MKRRRLFTIFSALCLLLALAITLATVVPHQGRRCYWFKRPTQATLYNSTVATWNYYFVTFDGGKMVIGQWRNPYSEHGLKGSLSDELALARYRLSHGIGNPLELEPRIKQYEDALADPDFFFKTDLFPTNSDPFARWYVRGDYAHGSFAGMSYDRWAQSEYSALGRRFIFPALIPIVLLLIPPAIGLRKARQRCLRRRRGQCPRCGYDLRASPDACPECGHTPANPSVSMARYPLEPASADA